MTSPNTLLAETAGQAANRTMANCLGEYYRLPDEWSDCLSPEPVGGKQGFFRFGPTVVCYGSCKTGNVSSALDGDLHDALNDIRLQDGRVHLPFDPVDLVENLYRERYEHDLLPRWEQLIGRKVPQKFYYFMRHLLPFSFRRTLQRAYFRGWQRIRFPAWPVDFTVDTLHEELLKLAMKARGVQRVPFIWFWPNGAPSCLIMTHDVEDSGGRDLTSQLMDLDESYGFRASFQVIPEERYQVTETYVREIRNRGFEFNVHDLNHDGHLYHERQEFLRRAKLINEYARHFGSRGFRAGSMHRNADWYEAFEFSYDMSVPNVAHLEPKRGGCCTVMPFFIGSVLELPLTTTQDYSLLHILKDYSIDLWKRQLALIRQRNGLMSFITHADYLADAREQSVYKSLLAYLRDMVAREGLWAPLPGDVDTWWRARNEMKLVSCNGGWRVEGPGSERSRVAYAVLRDGQLVYEL